MDRKNPIRRSPVDNCVCVLLNRHPQDQVRVRLTPSISKKASWHELEILGPDGRLKPAERCDMSVQRTALVVGLC